MVVVASHVAGDRAQRRRSHGMCWRACACAGIGEQNQIVMLQDTHAWLSPLLGKQLLAVAPAH